MNSDFKINSLILSSLFHDLGKFFQRTKYFEENHDEISSFFVDIINGKIDNLKKIEIIDKKIDFELVKNLILDHHKKIEEIDGDEDYKKLIYILKKADNLSAKKERIIDKLENLESFLVNQNDIFEYLFKNKNNLNNFYYHKINSTYNFDREYFFPQRIEKKSENENINLYKDLISKNNLGFLLKNFINKKITYLNFLYFLDEIFYLLFLYIPEDRRDKYQLNSLYDHLKLTTLYAQCFYYDDNYAYLLKYDIAGIQKFIFDIKPKKASQMLRGRSFFIQILTELVNYFLIKKLDLIPQNNLSSFGGNSLFIFPFKERIEEEIKSLFLLINRFFIEKLGFYIRYDLKRIEIKDDFFDFKKINLNPSLDKEILYEISRLNNKQIKTEEDYDQCDICEIYDKKYSINLNEEIINLCSNCNFILNLSSKIKKGQFINFNIETFEKILKDEISDLNFIFQEKDSSDYLNNIFYIKPFENLKTRFFLKEKFFFNSPSKTIFYKISQPQKGNKYLSFEEIAEKSEGSKSLIYLKADVDDMSKIIESGFDFRFDEEKYTKITDKLHFSRRINLFFQNYLPLFIEKYYKDYIYLIYSGGDDVFLVGSWDKVLDFVFKFKSEFDDFVCKNENIHFSSGAIIAKSDFPVYFAFEKTEEKLHQAKIGGKNKLSFLYSIENYENFKKIFDLGKLIGKTETISTSFLYKIFKLSDYFIDPINKYNQSVNFYKMIYFFERNIKKINDPKNELEKKYKEDHNQFFNFFQNFLNNFLSRNFNKEFDFIKRNLKTIINLSLIYRRGSYL